MPPLVLFLLYFLLECLSLIISVFEGNYDHTRFANGNKQWGCEGKKNAVSAELAGTSQSREQRGFQTKEVMSLTRPLYRECFGSRATWLPAIRVLLSVWIHLAQNSLYLNPESHCPQELADCVSFKELPFPFSFFKVFGFELRAYIWSHSISPFMWWVFFKIESHKLFA
jgi:hypothetical protein